ncbi:hypothetical protein LTR15_000795 [Elasticomyces elasticus]|nr:hypothetical protein LTR15_000795 [Elasticomyces elasticus]
MVPLLRRWFFYTVAAFIIIFLLTHAFQLFKHDSSHHRRKLKAPIDRLRHPGLFGTKFEWKNVPLRHPVENLTLLPSGPLVDIPQIQHDFEAETYDQRVQREARLAEVKQAFEHSWEGYKKNAWLQDEVAPVSGKPHNGFGGWGATLVDSLDTLWIMGLKKEFAIAVAEVRKIDFTTTPLEELNVFETTIRYLGGLLSAYDLSGHKHEILLQKAVELGEMLYVAFDTPNRMPVTRWDWKNGALGGPQQAARFSLLAEVGSLTLEFTRLSQLTGDHKYYDAVARITDLFADQQSRTKIPGLFATLIDTKNADFTRDTTFSLGGMSDSLYEYLPKQHLMLGGRNEQYRTLYESALASAKENLFFRPLNKGNQDLLISGTLKRNSAVRQTFTPEGEHLSCFTGGMVALAAKMFRQPHELETAKQLVNGCLWAYESMRTGIMPEIFKAVSCQVSEEDNCTFTNDRWYQAVAMGDSEQAQTIIARDNLAPGFVAIKDSRYMLRPEAIESLFVLYRITGDRVLQDKAWNMFCNISNVAKTKIAYAGLEDVRHAQPKLIDTMESFWTAETLKYFFLIFSLPDVISLDTYIFNTEAHPLLRPK